MKLIEQRRQGALFFLHHPSLASTGKEYSMNRYCPENIGHMKVGCSHDEVRWLLNEEDISFAGKTLIEKIKENPPYFTALVDLFEERCEINNNYCDSISKIRPRALSTEEILKMMNKGFEIYQKLWAAGLYMEEIEFHLSPLLKNNLLKQGVAEKEIQNIITTLITPAEETSSRSAEKNILRIVAQIQKTNTPFSKAIKQKEVKKLLQKHYARYYWSACNYFSFSGLGIESIEELVKTSLNQKKSAIETLKEMQETDAKILKENIRLKEKYKFNADTTLAFFLMKTVGISYDKRKKSQMHTFFSVGRLLKELSRRKKINFDLTKYLLPYELQDFTQGKISKETLALRRKYSFIDYNKEPIQILTGEEAKKIEEAIWKNTDLSKNQKEISGLCASQGSVVAKARVITSAKSLGEIKQGEILITGMTTPDYVPVLKKVVGMITDDGGITCHAAIIAREMKIPCIVGTKTATRKIKTGDLIDLRAHHGMARIVESAGTKNN